MGDICGWEGCGRRAVSLTGASWTLSAERGVHCQLGDRGSVRLVLMHEHHGSAVTVVRRLAGAFFGCKGTRRRRFRRPLLVSLAGPGCAAFGVSPVEVKVM